MPTIMVAVLRRHRRKGVLASPISVEETRLLASTLGFFRWLSEAERDKLIKLARVIVKEKAWEGCAGLTLTDDMKLVIAAQAALLLLGADIDPLTDAVFSNVQTILVYPSGFIAPTPRIGAAGVVTEGQANLGEAHYTGQLSGPIIVSWRHALEGGQNASDGRNLVLHEFAHKLDYLDGVSDGTPPLKNKEQYTAWKRIMSAHHADLVRRAQLGAPSLLDYYGATNPAEFFAVATETFFERGPEMRHWLPELYTTLRNYYGIETASWSNPGFAG